LRNDITEIKYGDISNVMDNEKFKLSREYTLEDGRRASSDMRFLWEKV
jgi:hypothetical protein